MRKAISGTLSVCFATALLASSAVVAQPAAEKKGHSPNIQEVAHLDVGPFMTVGGIAVEQELSRP